MRASNRRISTLTGPALCRAPKLYIHTSRTLPTFLFKESRCSFLRTSRNSRGFSCSSSHLAHIEIFWSMLNTTNNDTHYFLYFPHDRATSPPSCLLPALIFIVRPLPRLPRARLHLEHLTSTFSAVWGKEQSRRSSVGCRSL